MPLNLLFILNRMQLFYINFGDRNPPYPALGSNIPSARRPGLRFNFLQCRGSSPSVRFVNRHGGNPIKEGRVGCVHQNIFTRKVTDIAFTSDFFNNHYRPRVPASPSHTSPRPILDVPKSPVSRPQVPTHASHVPVPLSPSHFYTQPFETKSSYCRVARQGLPCYTAIARLGFKRRASAVLKSNLIRSTEFGKAVARRLKRA